jgi:hypothetical protein
MYLYRVINNTCKKLLHRVREVILRKKCYINIGPILFMIDVLLRFEQLLLAIFVLS